MAIPSTLKNWLLIAFQQESDDNSEYFYFDKKKNEFFSIHIIDHYLFDEKLNNLYGVSIYFTLEEVSILKERLKKINKKNKSIVSIPKLGILDNKEILEIEIEKFTKENQIDVENSTLFEVLQKSPVPLFERSIKKKRWWKFWS